MGMSAMTLSMMSHYDNRNQEHLKKNLPFSPQLFCEASEKYVVAIHILRFMKLLKFCDKSNRLYQEHRVDKHLYVNFVTN